MGNILNSGGTSILEMNDSLSSSDGVFTLIMQNDGNLVIYYNYKVNGENQIDAIWGAYGHPGRPASNSDALKNIVIATYGSIFDNKPGNLPASDINLFTNSLNDAIKGTGGVTFSAKFVLVMQGDSNLVVYCQYTPAVQGKTMIPVYSVNWANETFVPHVGVYQAELTSIGQLTVTAMDDAPYNGWSSPAGHISSISNLKYTDTKFANPQPLSAVIANFSGNVEGTATATSSAQYSKTNSWSETSTLSFTEGISVGINIPDVGSLSPTVSSTTQTESVSGGSTTTQETVTFSVSVANADPTATYTMEINGLVGTVSASYSASATVVYGTKVMSNLPLNGTFSGFSKYTANITINKFVNGTKAGTHTSPPLSPTNGAVQHTVDDSEIV